MAVSKTLKDKAMNELYKTTGAFYAFGDGGQLEEGLKEAKQNAEFNDFKEGDKWRHLAHGLYCMSKHTDKLLEGLNKINKLAIKLDIEQNGLEAIIVRELYNYEVFISYNIEDVKSALKGYNVTDEQIVNALQKEIPEFEKHNC